MDKLLEQATAAYEEWCKPRMNNVEPDHPRDAFIAGYTAWNNRAPAATVVGDRVHDYYHGPVWDAFGLTRASYAVFPRRALQSMPASWQQRLVDLINEMHASLGSDAIGADWTVNLRENGRFAKDWRSDYRHTGPLPAPPAPEPLLSGADEGLSNGCGPEAREG